MNSPVPELSPQGKVLAFTTAMYGDGTVTKPFVITEYNVINTAHTAALDPDPNPRDASEQLAAARKVDFKADYVGFTIDPHFVIGYGLDYAEKYRNLPDVQVLSD